MSKAKKIHPSKLDTGESKPLAMMILATVILAIGLVATNYFVKSLNFHTRVFRQKHSVVKKLESNQDSLDSLREEFVANEKTGPTSDEIFASLPTSKDFPQTSATLESIIKRSGVELQSVSLNTNAEEGVPEGEAEAPKYASPNPDIGEMVLTVEVSGSYDSIRDMLKNLEKSLRDFRVDSLEVSGSQDKITGNLQIKTYYQQAVDNTVKTEVIEL